MGILLAFMFLVNVFRRDPAGPGARGVLRRRRGVPEGGKKKH